MLKIVGGKTRFRDRNSLHALQEFTLIDRKMLISLILDERETFCGSKEAAPLLLLTPLHGLVRTFLLCAKSDSLGYSIYPEGKQQLLNWNILRSHCYYPAGQAMQAQLY